MGRGRNRNTAKTGDVALYKARDDGTNSSRKKEDNDDMYNEVDRYNNARDDLQDDMLKFGRNDDSSEEEAGNDVENVFDLGLDESDDDSNDDVSDDETGDSGDDITAKESLNEVSEDDSSIGDDFEAPDVLDWGKKKKDYYHGDTADLEIGQEVEDAELEEEAGKEVLKTRLQGMTEDDFMLDDDDEEDNDERDDKMKSEILSTAMTSTMQKNLVRLSKKEKSKLMEKMHPELLPLINHFRDEAIIPCVEETLVVTNAMFESEENAQAVGATDAGLQYLLTKAMLQTSTALNVCQYLLIKAENAKAASTKSADDNDDFIIDNQDDYNIKNHPVISRLNQLNHMSDTLRSDVESNVVTLKQQITNLVKASSLMTDGNESDEEMSNASDDDEEGDIDGDEALNLHLDITDKESKMDSTASSEEDDDEDPAEVQRRIMNEARFALRAQDDIAEPGDVEELERSTKRRRRRADVPSFSDYGEEDGIDEHEMSKAAKSLAATVNTISQRSKTNNKKPSSLTAEVDDDDNEDRFKRGLEMMEADLGAENDDGDYIGDDDVGMNSDDDDDFYTEIKKKSKAKKEFKKSLYAVAPKYPGMDDEIAGERAVGQMILKNRGLVAHKAKINRNPRVKKREQYRKAIIRRKGAVRDVRTDEGHKYGGEETGIKAGLSRSRKL
mmetsp:Transcript_15840/g.18400  ORF Transcript_15840/g.18400 Transcript_15840/m.18400 type:complete len:670 (+) Transcript_15840:83-2092(+)